jgi:hypothetical protein
MDRKNFLKSSGAFVLSATPVLAISKETQKDIFYEEIGKRRGISKQILKARKPHLKHLCTRSNEDYDRMFFRDFISCNKKVTVKNGDYRKAFDEAFTVIETSSSTFRAVHDVVMHPNAFKKLRDCKSFSKEHLDICACKQLIDKAMIVAHVFGATVRISNLIEENKIICLQERLGSYSYDPDESWISFIVSGNAIISV